MPRTIQCGACGAHLKLPDSIPAGKKLRCPKCRHAVVLEAMDRAPTGDEPRAATSSEPAATPASDLPPLQALPEDSAGDLEPDPLGAAPLAAQAKGSGPSAKACPFCGESIKPNAIKCRYCGEFLGERQGAPKRSPGKAKASSDELTPAEYITGTLLAPAGLIVGLVWAVKRLPKARSMLIISAAMTSLMLACAFAAYWYWPRTITSPRRVSQIPDFVPEFYEDIMPPEVDGSDELVESTTGSEDPNIDLENQPPEIRQALQANVRVELPGNAIGSGVVLRREKGWGWIISNRHVVDMRYARSRGTAYTPPEQIVARLTYVNNLSTRATVAWSHPDYDLVILKARCPADIEPAPWQPIPKLAIGEECFAVGNPVNLGWTYTRGVVSALREKSQEVNRFQSGPVIQTDVAIAGGSSGGGLYNRAGVLIGINTAMVHPEIAKGIGFAIQTRLLEELRPEVLGFSSAGTTPADSQDQAPQEGSASESARG